MTLQDFTDNRTTTTTTTEPTIKINKTKGLLERRGSNASLTIDLGSNSNISDIKPVLRLNTAKSVSNLYLSSQNNTMMTTERCMCRKKIGPETCGNCTIYESVPSKANTCKTKCQSFHMSSNSKKCRCLCNFKCKRKSLSNENLYVPPCNCINENQKHCKGNRKAYYPRQPDVEASQLLSEDFKLHLQNVQYLQTAGSVLTIADLKAACEVREDETNKKKWFCSLLLYFFCFQSHRVPKLHQEFWEVPLNLQEKCLVSGSQNRNRYRGVLPNEHSRVILPGLQSYIHANYIKVCVLRF